MSDYARTEKYFSDIAKRDATDATRATSSNGAASHVAHAFSPDATDATNPGASDKPQPGFVIHWSWWRFDGVRRQPGLWLIKPAEPDDDDDSDRPEYEAVYVAPPIAVQAVTADEHGLNFGRLLKLRNGHDQDISWSMPLELLCGQALELERALLSRGFIPAQFKTLRQYLREFVPDRRVVAASRTGWHGANFVLPSLTIGPTPDAVVYQRAGAADDPFRMSGRAEQWRDHVARLAIGNPMLTLALSVAFAGPLLGKVHDEGGGVHLVGESSTGKTSCLAAACSVWGSPDYRRSWRSTANGMEGAAALSNDCLLALDEISECSPHEVGQIAYALSNGRGKQRAARDGEARAVKQWRCAILSTGERTLATAMLEGGHAAKAGQTVRLLDIPVRRPFGAWDCLHGHPDGRALSDAIKEASATYYGTAGRAFLERLTLDQRDFACELSRIRQLPEFNGGDSSGQVKRAAARLALIAYAGELATDYGLTGWQSGAAVEAAAGALSLWRDARGHIGNDEPRKIIGQIADFIDKHGAARFEDLDYSSDRATINRAGWRRTSGSSEQYLFSGAGLREAAGGFDMKFVVTVLLEAGALLPWHDGGYQQPIRIGHQTKRVYVIDASKLEGR